MTGIIKSRKYGERKLRKGEERSRYTLLNISSTSLNSHTHTRVMQIHLYILNAHFICISNTLTFVFQTYSTKDSQIGPNLAADTVACSKVELRLITIIDPTRQLYSHTRAHKHTHTHTVLSWCIITHVRFMQIFPPCSNLVHKVT